ncbi:MAG: hypothetical protein AAF950_14930 [Pseudomonadota bacterium]
MVMCNCIVQAGQIPADTEAALKSKLNGFTQRAFGEPAQINWVAIPEKSGFTATKPSTSSIVSMRAPKPMEQPKREALLRELGDLWTAETKCSLDEVVSVIADPENN